MRRSIPTLISVLLVILICHTSVSCGQEKSTQQGDSTSKKGQAEKQDHTNRLADETSPYLLMHAHNPVDWFPWGEEALKKAKDENKVIFLSIGYSSCHWCHVMERESFLDDEIAKFMNENFVCIKVDREERPDIDSIYMTSLHVYNQVARGGGGGGWPLSMFLTPDAKPFFGGTYFPPRDGNRGARIGFLTVLNRVRTAWNEKRDLISRDADKIAELTRNELDGKRGTEGGELDSQWIDQCKIALYGKFDPQHGGFGFSDSDPRIPKFPEVANLLFLIDVLRNKADDAQARTMLIKTLDSMSQGGIYDHLGGGFHRYSVDRFWQIPHFEKMLYDNGLLLSAYAEAYELTKSANYRFVAEGIAEYIIREMTSPDGGFYSALDAESEDEEGKFYRWERQQLQASLNEQEFGLFARVYGIDKDPNFEDKYYAPQLAKSLDDIAADLKLDPQQLREQLIPIRKKLLEIRSKRTRPLTDTKILTGWNGLMIRGLADAGRILEQPELIAAATRAAEFVLENSLVDGRLKRTNTDGKARLNAYLNDYSFLIDALIALHRATHDELWLVRAVALQEKQNELFWDEAGGGYFFTSHDHESLLARAKQPTDGAIPSGNSVAAGNLLYLAEKGNKPEYKELSEKTLKGLSGMFKQFPRATPVGLIALRKLLDAK